MAHSPLLLLHIVSGTVGMLSGFVAVFLRKGSRRHALAGSVFVVSMLCLSASGTYLATVRHQPGNILGGSLTFYLVATAWMTARRRDEAPGIFDWAALLVILGVAATELTFGVEAAMSPTGMKYDYPPWPYFIFGSVAALAFAGDVRMLVRGGIAGTQRLARHLWRMCFALFIAAASIFLARQQLFPALLQKTGALVFLSILPLILLVFWMLRVRFAKAYKTNAKVGTQLDYAGGDYAVGVQALTSSPLSRASSSSLENQLGRL
jgi:uncharacterized membrane protein